MNPSQTLNPGFHTPTKDDLYIAGMGIQDDSSFASFSFAAAFVDPAFTQNFAAYANQHGGVPARIHNEPGGAAYGKHITFSGRLTDDMIADLNAGVDPATVITVDRMNAAAAFFTLKSALAAAQPADRVKLQAQIFRLAATAF